MLIGAMIQIPKMIWQIVCNHIILATSTDMPGYYLDWNIKVKEETAVPQ